MKKTFEGNKPSEIEQLRNELVLNHLIDPDDYVSGTFTLGADEGWRDALDRKAREKINAARENPDLRNNEVACRERSISRLKDRKFRSTPPENWNLYSVHITTKGVIKPGLQFAGQRKHPSIRTGEKGEVRFDCTGCEVKVYLPPLIWEHAMRLLDHHGFICPREDYSPETAWKFIFSNPAVPIWVEESALKALSSTSHGQLAVGINGINSGGQKTRSDRLRVPLRMLAKGGRRMVVRFDNGSHSERAAQRLTGQLNRAGAYANWFTWTDPDIAKTDDYFAAKGKALVAGTFDRSADQTDSFNLNEVEKGHYSRIKGDWRTTTIDREFEPMDIIQAQKQSRVIALEGPTGTGKTKASVGAIDLMEEAFGQKIIVLGLYHRASLVHKGAAEFGVRDLSSPLGTVDREQGKLRDGLFCCCESIKKDSGEWELCRWSNELKETPRPAVLFLDEVTQAALHLLLDGTDAMPKIRREAIKTLERLIRNPEVIVIAAEAGIGDIELEWLQALSGVEPQVINTTIRRRANLFYGAATADNIDKLQQLCGETIDQGQQIWISMGEKSALESFSAPFSRSFLIHGDNSKSEEVAALMANTNSVAAQYPLVGYSPAVVSGISYEASTVGIATCVQQFAMGPQDAMQAVARARSAERRIILSPVSAPMAKIGTGRTSPEEVNRARFTAIDPTMQKLYGQHLSGVDPATVRYSVALEARTNYEALNNKHILRCRLIDQGYNLRSFDELISDNAVVIPKAQRDKQTKQAQLDRRTELLHEVMTGQKTIEQASSEADREAKHGTWVDLGAVDPRHAYHWLQQVRVHDLISAGSFTTDSPEFLAMAAEVQSLNKHEARELRDVLGGRIVIPGPDDDVKATFAKALLKVAGFTTKGKRVKRAGELGYRYEVTDL
ncbi:DUF3854 domain-containing protein [Synechococcus sp. MIT S1220]|uniref:DUF3854 domain-containing protein n=1 Tax=Synechococcus sp. MIT S1220 TaxID=3082549 RepID=UPI0039B0A708